MGIFLRNKKGDAVVDVLLMGTLIIFIILPIFAVVVEKQIINNKAQLIKDALDLTNISTYNAINTPSLGKGQVALDDDAVLELYQRLLAKNLNLNDDLSPKENSIAEDTVIIDSLVIYTSGFLRICPEGTTIKRPAVHSCVIVPVKPSLFRKIILDSLGKQLVELKVHVDSDIPVNN